jgi:hypothetical protein
MRGKALLALVAAAFVLCFGTTLAGAKSNAWQKNTWHLTRAGSLHMYFLLPKHSKAAEFFIQLLDPTDVSRCKLLLDGRTMRPKLIANPDYPVVYFRWPKMRVAARATATCAVVGSVSRVTVVLGPRGTIRLRHT